LFLALVEIQNDWLIFLFFILSSDKFRF